MGYFFSETAVLLWKVLLHSAASAKLFPGSKRDLMNSWAGGRGNGVVGGICLQYINSGCGCCLSRESVSGATTGEGVLPWRDRGVLEGSSALCQASGSYSVTQNFLSHNVLRVEVKCGLCSGLESVLDIRVIIYFQLTEVISPQGYFVKGREEFGKGR